MSFYYFKSRDTDRYGKPYEDDNAKRVVTPEDWTAIAPRWKNTASIWDGMKQASRSDLTEITCI